MPRLLAYAVMTATGAAWSLHTRGTIVRAPTTLLNDSGSLSAQIIGCSAALAVSWLTVHATRVLVTHTSWARALHVSLRAELMGASPLQLALLSGMAAISEELLFRAALSSTLGIVASSALFGFAHAFSARGSLLRCLWAFAMGLCFAVLFWWSGSLLAPVLAHWLINYENMQYICNYDPTPLDIDRLGWDANRRES